MFLERAGALNGSAGAATGKRWYQDLWPGPALPRRNEDLEAGWEACTELEAEIQVGRILPMEYFPPNYSS